MFVVIKVILGCVSRLTSLVSGGVLHAFLQTADIFFDVNLMCVPTLWITAFVFLFSLKNVLVIINLKYFVKSIAFVCLFLLFYIFLFSWLFFRFVSFVLFLFSLFYFYSEFMPFYSFIDFYQILMIGIVLWVDSHTSSAQNATTYITYNVFVNLKIKRWLSDKDPSIFAWKNNWGVWFQFWKQIGVCKAKWILY